MRINNDSNLYANQSFTVTSFLAVLIDFNIIFDCLVKFLVQTCIGMQKVNFVGISGPPCLSHTLDNHGLTRQWHTCNKIPYIDVCGILGNWIFFIFEYTVNGQAVNFSCYQAALRTLISVHPFVRLSVTPFWQCSCHPIILKLSGRITIDKSEVHAKGHCQRSKVKTT